MNSNYRPRDSIILSVHNEHYIYYWFSSNFLIPHVRDLWSSQFLWRQQKHRKSGEERQAVNNWQWFMVWAGIRRRLGPNCFNESFVRPTWPDCIVLSGSTLFSHANISVSHILFFFFFSFSHLFSLVNILLSWCFGRQYLLSICCFMTCTSTMGCAGAGEKLADAYISLTHVTIYALWRLDNTLINRASMIHLSYCHMKRESSY